MVEQNESSVMASKNRSNYFPNMQNQTDKETMSIVDDIQTNYPGALVFIFRNLSKIERLALWSESNILLITSLRDG